LAKSKEEILREWEAEDETDCATLRSDAATSQEKATAIRNISRRELWRAEGDKIEAANARVQEDVAFTQFCRKYPTLGVEANKSILADSPGLKIEGLDGRMALTTLAAYEKALAAIDPNLLAHVSVEPTAPPEPTLAQQIEANNKRLANLSPEELAREAKLERATRTLSADQRKRLGYEGTASSVALQREAAEQVASAPAPEKTDAQIAGELLAEKIGWDHPVSRRDIIRMSVNELRPIVFKGSQPNFVNRELIDRILAGRTN
jgi:hypothetical protein